MAIVVITMANPPAASVMDTAVSNGVSKLKCDGTPRHACMDTSDVSTTHVTVNAPSRRFRVRGIIGTKWVTHATVASVSPKERPNVAGLRSDTGPVHVPPETISTTRCTSPLRNSSPPTA
jgi:hypothetical protein